MNDNSTLDPKTRAGIGTLLQQTGSEMQTDDQASKTERDLGQLLQKVGKDLEEDGQGDNQSSKREALKQRLQDADTRLEAIEMGAEAISSGELDAETVKELLQETEFGDDPTSEQEGPDTNEPAELAGGSDSPVAQKADDEGGLLDVLMKGMPQRSKRRVRRKRRRRQREEDDDSGSSSVFSNLEQKGGGKTAADVIGMDDQEESQADELLQKSSERTPAEVIRESG